MARSIQLNSKGQLTHLLSIEGVPRAILVAILDRAKDFLRADGLGGFEVVNAPVLSGKTI